MICEECQRDFPFTALLDGVCEDCALEAICEAAGLNSEEMIATLYETCLCGENGKTGLR